MLEAPAQQPEKKGFALFGRKKEETGPDISAVLEQVNTVARRLRIIESRYTDLNRKVQVTEKNMLGERKRLTRELKVDDSDILDLKRSVNELKSKVDVIASELKNFAVKEDVVSLKKYVDLWEPIEFVTREEVEKIVKETIEEKKVK